MLSFFIRLLFALAFLPFFGCSSAPKRPMLVTDTYTLAHSRLENANNELLSGKLSAAKRSLSESYSLAVSVDSAALLTKICLSGVSYKILEKQLGDNSDSEKSPSIQTEKKSFLDGDMDSVLGEAKSFARRSSEKDALLDLCALYEFRVMLARLHISNEKKLS